ncbi:MAG TPA: fatty acid desaturase [Gammaproteobacteria bacterium]|nr:fatty acid desaturase [Gammaproteobacteria bacterium]
MEFLYTYRYGLLDLAWWQYVLVALAWMHITLMGITLWFHRDQAHRSIDLHPALAHFFRFWLWLSTGAATKEWVAVHRKHHAMCEVEGDPHSPQIFGLRRVLLEGAELYQSEARKTETLEKYGKGTPDDWLERNVYGRFVNTGIALLVVLDLVLFGAPGVILLAIQLLTMPVLAAGVINGLCHARGYRNFETNDASTNLWPLGLFVAGEELHNNHHAFPTSARFSMRRGELDMGWLHLKLFSWLGLARIRRVARPPQLRADTSSAIDIDSLRAIIVNRMYVLRHYLHEVTLPALEHEAGQRGAATHSNSMIRSAARLLRWQPHLLDAQSQDWLTQLIERHPSLESVLEYRNELKSFWEGAHTSNEKLLADFRAWCARAEASGIQGMQDFVAYLRSFRAMPESALAT